MHRGTAVVFRCVPSPEVFITFACFVPAVIIMPHLSTMHNLRITGFIPVVIVMAHVSILVRKAGACFIAIRIIMRKVRCAKWEDKQMSVAFWGIASDKLGKQFTCGNCKRMW